MSVRSLKYFSRVNAYWCIMKPIDGASIQNFNHVLKSRFDKATKATLLIKMPFLGTIWILPKSRPNSNFGAICTGPTQAVEMAQKFEIRLEIVTIDFRF